MYSSGPAPAPCLVPTEVSAAKLAAELADWDHNAALYARRGWVLLERGELHVTVAFLAQLPWGMATLPVVTACVRVDFTNYDLWPPSVLFLDPLTRQPASPPVRAPHAEADGPRDALVDGHPDTGQPFLCLPGVREYHSHPQHSGDLWLLHRRSGHGRLAVLCERIWQRMAQTVLGVRVTVQTLPGPLGGAQLEFSISQGDPTVITAALAHQQAGPQPPGPPAPDPALAAAAQLPPGQP